MRPQQGSHCCSSGDSESTCGLKGLQDRQATRALCPAPESQKTKRGALDSSLPDPEVGREVAALSSPAAGMQLAPPP